MSRDYAAEGMDFKCVGRPKGFGWDDVAKTFSTSGNPQHMEAAMYCGVLFGLAAQAKPKTIVEIGTQFGLSTRMWLAVPEVEAVHSMDIDPECATRVKDPRWTFHLGKSQDLEPVPCDLLYVDGDHSYEAVCSDMARHGAAVRTDGLVILDDYHPRWPGKMKWVDERWDILQPVVIGPTAVFRVTPTKRNYFR